MRRPELKKGLALFCAAAALLLAFLASCSSAAGAGSVDPMSLLDSGANAYFSVPVRENFDFSKKVVFSFVSKKDVSEKDIEKILERIDTLYSCVDFSTGGIQMSSSGNFPVTLSKFFMTEKNGWKSKKFGLHKYSEHSSGLDLSFISSDLACVSTGSAPLEKMLSRYDSALAGGEIDTTEFPTDERDITFFFPNASDILDPLFEGLPVRISGVESVSGSLFQVSGREEFDMTLRLTLRDPKHVRALCAIFSLAGFQVSADGSDVVLGGFRMSWSDVISMLQGAV